MKMVIDIHQTIDMHEKLHHVRPRFLKLNQKDHDELFAYCQKAKGWYRYADKNLLSYQGLKVTVEPERKFFDVS